MKSYLNLIWIISFSVLKSNKKNTQKLFEDIAKKSSFFSEVLSLNEKSGFLRYILKENVTF